MIQGLSKIRLKEINKQVKSLNDYEIKLLARKNKLESDELIELHTKIATNISIQKSFKYYLVEVKTNGENRISSKINYIKDPIRGGYDFIISSKDVVNHLKVWVKE